MIVFTLAGESTRFTKNGYTTVKYLLKLNGREIIHHILSYVDVNQQVLLIINKKHRSLKTLDGICKSLGMTNFKIVEIGSTDGQLTTLYVGLKEIIRTASTWVNLNYPILIFNGDTIRKSDYRYYNSEGYIETFQQEGHHWSFVDSLGRVSKVTEKEKISDFCSTGLYGFSSINLLLEYYSDNFELNENFIAPLYNSLIKDGLLVISSNVSSSNFIPCGIPEEYEKAKILYESN